MTEARRVVGALTLFGHSPRLAEALRGSSWTATEAQQYLQARVPADAIPSRHADDSYAPTPSPERNRGVSVRSFGSSLVTDEQMVELIRLSCGTADAPGVAQAGGVGGVKVHAMLSRQDGVTESFVYEADNGVLVPASVGEGTLLRCVDTSDVNRVPALIVLAIDLVARRGYRNAYDLSLIEVGQVYQRLEDNARHLGLRVCAMGAVAGAASLHDTMTSPVLGVVIGVPEESKK